MKKHKRAILAVFVIVIALVFQKSEAIELPALELGKARVSYKGDQYVWIEFETKNVQDEKAIVFLSKKGEKFTRTGEGSLREKEPNRVRFGKLVPETTYLYRVEIKDGNQTVVRSPVQSFTTRSKDHVVVTRVSARKVKSGDKIVIEGRYFGPSQGEVRIGYCDWTCDSSILSWSDTKIEVTVSPQATDGPLQVLIDPETVWRSTTYSSRVSAGEMDVLRGKAPYVLPGGALVVADTYDEPYNITKLYLEEWGRYARKDELIFHMKNKTDHDRLRKWLKEQVDGKWWKELLVKHEGQTVKDSVEAKDMYLVTGDGLRLVPDFQTALSWGFIPDDVRVVKNFSIRQSKGAIDQGKINPLHYFDGSYFREVEKYLTGKSFDTGSERLNSLIENYGPLIQVVGPYLEEKLAKIEGYTTYCGTVFGQEFCGKRW